MKVQANKISSSIDVQAGCYMSRSSSSSRSIIQQGWFSVGFREDQSWIFLALSRATINSDARVSSRQHCSSCTVMCHVPGYHWYLLPLPADQNCAQVCSALCEVIPQVYCVTVYSVNGRLISRRLSKKYPRELRHLTKGFMPIKAMSFNGTKWRRDKVWSDCISIIQVLPVLHCPSTCHPPLMILM